MGLLRRWLVLTSLVLAALGCDGGGDADAGDDSGPSTCEALEPLEEGDPDGHAAPLGAAAGEARAGRLAASDIPDDPTGLLGWRAGDFVLANDRIAVVIEDVGESDDFNPWGGQPVGVALIEDGALAQPALFGELSFTFGKTTIATESVTVLNDGSDGEPAVVRAIGGVDSLGVLIFLGALISGDEAPGLRVAFDYVLAADAEQVEVRVQALNSLPEQATFSQPLLTSVQQNRMPKVAPGQGFDVDPGGAVPWMGFIDEDGASYAFEADGGDLRVYLEQSNFLFLLMPRFSAPGCAATERVLGRLHVGGPGLDGLQLAIQGSAALEAVSGSVSTSDGQIAGGARVYALDADGAILTRTTTASDGTFRLHVPAGDVTLRSWRRGEPPSAESPVTAPASAVELTLGGSGEVMVTVTDGDGAPLGALVQLSPDGDPPFVPPAAWGEAPIQAGRDGVAYAAEGTARLRAPTGPHTLVVSRGYEHEMVSRTVDVGAALAEETVVLEHTVPTPGVMCGDFHIHTNRSFDAEDEARLKVRMIAAEGLEIPARSDHEWVADFEPLIAEAGLEDQMFGIASLELTTFTFGHFGVFPLDPSDTARNGGAIEWVDRSPREVLGEARSREGRYGRSELIINHPRALPSLVGYFSTVGYNPETAEVGQPDLWYDEFVLLEVFNHTDFDANEDGTVADWFSFLSHGRRVMAVGSSDSHEAYRSPVGYPRTCIELGVDTPPELRALGAGIVRDQMVAGASSIVGGVYVEASAGSVGLGGTVTEAAERTSVDVTVRAASWIDVDRLRVFVDGALVETITLDESTRDALDPTRRFSGALEVPVAAAGSWAVFVADGDDDLAPVHPGRRPFGVTNPIFFER